jgi:hypothetical protein
MSSKVVIMPFIRYTNGVVKEDIGYNSKDTK